MLPHFRGTDGRAYRVKVTAGHSGASNGEVEILDATARRMKSGVRVRPLSLN